MAKSPPSSTRRTRGLPGATRRASHWLVTGRCTPRPPSRPMVRARMSSTKRTRHRGLAPTSIRRDRIMACLSARLSDRMGPRPDGRPCSTSPRATSGRPCPTREARSWSARPSQMNPDNGSRLEVAQRYEWIFWIAIGVQAMTGVGNLGAFGQNIPAATTPWGARLTVKLVAVLALALVSVPRTLAIAALSDRRPPAPVGRRSFQCRPVTIGMIGGGRPRSEGDVAALHDQTRPSLRIDPGAAHGIDFGLRDPTGLGAPLSDVDPDFAVAREAQHLTERRHSLSADCFGNSPAEELG